jgi:hypothetical protein
VHRYNAPVPSPRAALRALLPFALHALAREVDAAVGLLLRTSLDLPDFVAQALRLVDPAAALGRVAAWIAAGAGLWAVLALLRSRRDGTLLAAALDASSAGFAPLYLRPALSLLALASLAVQPAYPYAFTLPVALTQDLSVAQDAAALAALVALHAPRPRLPAPGAASLGLIAFILYALMTPSWARHWDGHPGNEPKTLRMAVALGHGLTLDVEGVSAAMEALPTRSVAASVRAAAAALAGESARMLAALARGPRAVGASAIEATRITRQTVRGKGGGVFHVLAPGVSAILAPALRIDRAVNLHRGTSGPLGATLLLWNALAAALVSALYLLARDATGHKGLSAALAVGFALTPPFLFYFFQFYPEMLGALALALALRALLFRRWWTTATMAWMGVLLALLPWLHQKFLLVWAVLAVMAVVKAVGEMAPLRALLWLTLPQLASAYLFVLYNFAITGSVRPDALYLAWGPAGVSSARVGQGLLGLLLDARYGILPYAPIYSLAAGGLLVITLARNEFALAIGRGGLSGPPRPPAGARRLRWGLPAMAVYYVTVASADNWSGAVCNLGRYVMPVAPWAAALVAVALAVTGHRRGVAALALALAAWTGLFAAALWADPHAANDCALLLARSVFADGNAYIPNLFIRAWSDGAPGLFARVAVWGVLIAAASLWIRRAARGRGGDSPVRALAGLAALVLAAAFLLERWPTLRTGPRYRDALGIGPGVTAFLVDGVTVEEDRARTRGGALDLVVRSREPLPSVTVLAEGEGTLRVGGRAAVVLSGRPVALTVPLDPIATLVGRRGVGESLARQRLMIETQGEVVLRLRAPEGGHP